MIIPDVNLLLYANVSAFPQHAAARKWWQDCLNARQPVGLPLPVVFGFIRIGTNPRVLSPPLAPDDAIARIEGWLTLRHVTVVHPGPRHLDIAFDLIRQLGTAGGLTTDIQVAALAIELQAEVNSNDTDFARFPGLRWRNPLS